MDINDLVDLLSAVSIPVSALPENPPMISVGDSVYGPPYKAVTWEPVEGFLEVEFEIRRKLS